MQSGFRIIHMAIPENAEVHIQPQGHNIARDDSLSQQCSHVLEDVVGRDDLILAAQVQADMAQEEAKQAVHGVDQLAAVLKHHTLLQLARQNNLTHGLTGHPRQRDQSGTPARTD